MRVHEAVSSLRAVRNYSVQEVPFEVIREIVNAARLSASSRNAQPWRFIVLRERENLRALSEMGHYAAHVSDASFCVMILTPDPERQLSAIFDAGQAAAFMQLSALEMGIGSCIVKLHEGTRGSDTFGYPRSFVLVYAIAFGFPKDGSEFKPFKKSRRPLSDLCFLEHWGVKISDF